MSSSTSPCEYELEEPCVLTVDVRSVNDGLKALFKKGALIKRFSYWFNNKEWTSEVVDAPWIEMSKNDEINQCYIYFPCKTHFDDPSIVTNFVEQIEVYLEGFPLKAADGKERKDTRGIRVSFDNLISTKVVGQPRSVQFDKAIGKGIRLAIEEKSCNYWLGSYSIQSSKLELQKKPHVYFSRIDDEQEKMHIFCWINNTVIEDRRLDNDQTFDENKTLEIDSYEADVTIPGPLVLRGIQYALNTVTGNSDFFKYKILDKEILIEKRVELKKFNDKSALYLDSFSLTPKNGFFYLEATLLITNVKKYGLKFDAYLEVECSVKINVNEDENSFELSTQLIRQKEYARNLPWYWWIIVGGIATAIIIIFGAFGSMLLALFGGVIGILVLFAFIYIFAGAFFSFAFLNKIIQSVLNCFSNYINNLFNDQPVAVEYLNNHKLKRVEIQESGAIKIFAEQK